MLFVLARKLKDQALAPELSAPDSSRAMTAPAVHVGVDMSLVMRDRVTIPAHRHRTNEVNFTRDLGLESIMTADD